MSGLFKGMVLGAGGALGLCSQTESLNDVPRSLLRTALKGYDKISVSHSNSPGANNYGDGGSGNAPLNDEMQKLSQQIRELKMQNGSNKPIIMYGSSGTGIYKVILIGTTGVVVLYYFGYSFNDIMYVTKAGLNKAVETLESQITQVGEKLEKTKNELMKKITGVEIKIEEASQTLEERIQQQTAEIRVDLSDLHVKMSAIEKSQWNIEKGNERLSAHLHVLDNKFDRNGEEIRQANDGIALLVNSVIDLPNLNKDLVKDLRSYLRQKRNQIGEGFERIRGQFKNINRQRSGLLGLDGVYGEIEDIDSKNLVQDMQISEGKSEA